MARLIYDSLNALHYFDPPSGGTTPSGGFRTLIVKDGTYIVW